MGKREFLTIESLFSVHFTLFPTDDNCKLASNLVMVYYNMWDGKTYANEPCLNYMCIKFEVFMPPYIVVCVYNMHYNKKGIGDNFYLESNKICPKNNYHLNMFEWYIWGWKISSLEEKIVQIWTAWNNNSSVNYIWSNDNLACLVKKFSGK